jgi:hypothetical protein
MKRSTQLWSLVVVVCLGGASVAGYFLLKDSRKPPVDMEDLNPEEVSRASRYDEANHLFESATDAATRREWDRAQRIYEEIIEKFPDEMASIETFGKMAAEGIASLDCLKVRQPKDFHSSFEIVSKAVLNAIEARDQERLKRFGSCGFYVGRFETDAQMGVYLSEALPVILDLIKGRDWRPADWSTPEFQVLESSAEDGTYFLTFTQDQGGWFWTGFVFDDENLFQKFKWSGRAFFPNDASR